MSSSDSRSSPPDGFTPVLLLVAIIAVVAPALTFVGVIGLASVCAVAGFFGSRNLSILVAGATVVATAVSWPSIGTLDIWLMLYSRYRAALDMPNVSAEVSNVWLNPMTDRAGYWALFSAGAVVGMAVLLLRKDILNRNEALLATSARRRRAPAAFLSAWLFARLPNRFFYLTVVGTEFYRGWPICLSDRGLTKHSIAAGTTGAGKTEFSLGLIESAIRKGHAVICIDGKGDLEVAERIRKFARKKGRKFYMLNGIDVSSSDVYNPLASGTFTSKSDRIIAIRSNWTEPHYETLAVGFTQTVFKILDHQKLTVDLKTLSNYMSTTALLALLRRKGYSDPEKQKLAAEIANQREAEQTAIASLKSEITNIANSSLGVLFDTEKASQAGMTVFNLAKARAESAVVYFALPGLLYPKTAGSIARLVLNDCKAIASTSKHPILITLEERSVYPGPQASHLLSLGRTSKLQVLNLCQSLSDLRIGLPEHGDAASEQTFGSTNTYAFFQLNSAEDAETAARLIGTNIEKQFTAQTHAGTPTGASSSRKVHGFKFHPDELKFQCVGQAILLDKNRSTVRKALIRKSTI